MRLRHRGQLAVAATCLLFATACVTTHEEGGIPTAKPDLVEAARLNTQLGIDYARQGKNDLALEKLQRALDQDDSSALTHSTIAFVYARAGDDKLADKHYRRAIQIDPKDPEVHNNFGVFLCANGRPKDGEEQLKLAAADSRYRTPEVALTNAGVCARKLPDLAKAEAYLRQALQINPQFPDALAQMAWLSYQKKDYLKSRAFLQRYQLVGRPTPETLKIGMLTETALGDTAAARAYEQRLKREFPDFVDGASPPVTSP
jgi:type IV pilus assembly protein PilF